MRGTQVSPLACLHLPSAFVVDLGGFWKHIHRTLHPKPSCFICKLGLRTFAWLASRPPCGSDESGYLRNLECLK